MDGGTLIKKGGLTMKRTFSLLLAAAGLAALSGSAAARDNVSFSLSIGAPTYGYSYAPPPAYYSPPPVYYTTPAPVYYAPRPYYAPAPVVVYRDHRGWDHGRGHGHGYGHR
jgi:hypothetical protein